MVGHDAPRGQAESIVLPFDGQSLYESDVPRIESLWTSLDDYPPLKCRLMAHRPVRTSTRTCIAPTDEEIAIESGIPLDRVRQISRMLDWTQVRLGEMRAFCAACRFDPTNPEHRRKLSDYETKCLQRHSQPFQWLHRSPVFAEQFLPLIKKLNRSLSPNQHVA